MLNNSGAGVQRVSRYSDVLLAVGVLVIVSLMVFRLPTALIDVLVGVNIAIGIGLLLLAIYIPNPVAFNSFPSVLLVSTLFRLSLSVATTRLILLDADAGDIITAFGNFVAGGNLVVGIVVFVIITTVQFIVIAKGAERVAEVAARFTLDAMPGKQMSIDSDLRSGLIDKDEAKRRREQLAQESQLNGALDGAMKFVKGDAIASIIIVIVNLVGGLAVGMLQGGMSVGDAVQVYSVLTIGDGMVAQVPALLGAMAAGLVVTRTSGENRDRHLGEAISRQILEQPRALLVTGIIALMMAWVPGFPSLVFLCLGSSLVGLSYWVQPSMFDRILRRKTETADFIEGQLVEEDKPFDPVRPLLIELCPKGGAALADHSLRYRLSQVCSQIGEEMGVALPEPQFAINPHFNSGDYQVSIFDVREASGSTQLAGEQALEELLYQLEATMRQHIGQFLAVQEVSDLVDTLGKLYPALVREVTRVVSYQEILEILRNLLHEGIPIRNMRDILGALVQWGEKEKDVEGLTEFVRIGLKPYITRRFADDDNNLHAWVVDPELEQLIRGNVNESPAGSVLMLEPVMMKQLQQGLLNMVEQNQIEPLGDNQALTQNNADLPQVILTAVDVRRHIRTLFADVLPQLSVLSYHELNMPINVVNLGQVTLGATDHNEGLLT